MTDFENDLWLKLVSDHGAQLRRLDPRPHDQRAPNRLLPAALGLIALLGAVLAATLTLTASTSPPAYALVVNSNGTVSLTINELIGVQGANAQLARLGVRARVAKNSQHCGQTRRIVRWPANLLHRGTQQVVEPQRLHDGFSGLRILIRPRLIPPGDSILLTARLIKVHPSNLDHHATGLAVGMTMGLFRGPAPICKT